MNHYSHFGPPAYPDTMLIATTVLAIAIMLVGAAIEVWLARQRRRHPST